MRKKEFTIQGLDCPDCAKVLEVDISKAPGVAEAELNFFQGKLIVSGDFNDNEIYDRIQNLGYVAVKEESRAAEGRKGLRAAWTFLIARKEMKMVLISALLFLISIILSSLGSNAWVARIIQLVALVLVGYPIFLDGIRGLLISHSLNINFLMTVAAIGAVVIGEIGEAVILMLLFNISEALESYTNDRARDVLNEMSDLAPRNALRISDSGEQEISIEDLQIGDVILVKAGERFPMDGDVLDGRSEVNQAPLTGESHLVLKEPGDEVLSGTINGQGVLKVRVKRIAADTTIQRIIQLVTEAQSSKAKKQKFIDTFAKYYTPIIVALAVLLAVIPPLFFDAPFFNVGDERGWLYRALSLLVIGCPCALVISTPVTIISSLTKAAREGIIFKGGIFMEKLSKVKVFAFDKTGTLTRGTPNLVQLRALDCNGEETCEACDDLLALASALEKHSAHPISRAVFNAGVERGLSDRYTADNLTTLNGKGLQGNVDGRLATVGSLALFESEHETPQTLSDWTRQAEEQGQTTMLVCDGDHVRGFLSIADTPRPEAASVIADLNASGIRTVMLTGDNLGVAQNVAETLGIKDYLAQLLPEDKLTAVKQLREKYGEVVMVGDGINDSPALAIADVGVAMGGSGNAQVLETADIVLMGDDLRKLVFAVKLSAFTNRLILHNIIFSLVIKFIIAILALIGLTPLWVAVLADMGVSLLVTFNGMRVLKFAPKPKQS
jgi:Cd2+/Zn2+-exporting ATPase